MDMDIEAVHEVSHTSWFDRIVAVLLGLGAVLAASAATIQMDAAKQEERALLRSSRLAVQVFELTAGTGPIPAFAGQGLQQGGGVVVEGLSRSIVSGLLPHLAAEGAVAAADQRAGDRIRTIALAMAGAESPPVGLDAHLTMLVDTARRDVREIVRALEEQTTDVRFPTQDVGDRLTAELSTEVDLADRHSDRGGRSLLALALLALGGVLIGLAAVLKENAAGWVALASAGLAVAASAVLAGLAFFG